MDRPESFARISIDQSKVREKLIQLIQRDPKPRAEIAKAIGISHVTFTRFLVKEENVKTLIFLKIKKYVEENEK